MADDAHLLSDEQRNYYRHYEQMFLSEGWSLFKEQLRSEVDALNEQITYTLLPEIIPVARARRDFAEEMLRLEDLVEMQKEQLMMEARQVSDDDYE